MEMSSWLTSITSFVRNSVCFSLVRARQLQIMQRCFLCFFDEAMQQNHCCEGADGSSARIIKTVEFGWPFGMPVCRSLGGGICELRTQSYAGPPQPPDTFIYCHPPPSAL